MRGQQGTGSTEAPEAPLQPAALPPGSGFTRFATGFAVYLVIVILFGAWVRITHSGAGCGSHWPTCHGDIVPLAPSIETIIEYTHRLTSGLLGIGGLVLVGWAWRRFGRRRVTAAALVTLLFIVVEALIGAGLVLKELVVDDDSVARAVVISIHLVNTLILTAAAVLTAYWSRDGRPLLRRHFGRVQWLLLAGLALLIVTSMTGAITALGDTLFPVDAAGTAPVLERIASDLAPAQHFLVRLRIVHPIVAVCTALALLWIAGATANRDLDPRTTRLARILQGAVAIEVTAGVVNIALAAPGWLQIIHLLIAQAVWVATLLTLAASWAATSAAAAQR